MTVAYIIKVVIEGFVLVQNPSYTIYSSAYTKMGRIHLEAENSQEIHLLTAKL